jgi:hypothetical protein
VLVFREGVPFKGSSFVCFYSSVRCSNERLLMRRLVTFGLNSKATRLQSEYVVEMALDKIIVTSAHKISFLNIIYSCRCSDCRRYEVTSNNKGHGRPAETQQRVEKVDLDIRVR